MAKRQQASDYSYKFDNVQIFKNQELGHGSYGAVYKAKCDTLPCAAKLIYPVLFGSMQAVPQSGKEHRQPMRRFEAECHFLSQIKHPNIVQYLGMYRDPETNAPALLMELMDESLTHFLEKAHNPILFHIQVNILQDTALALAFLHTNGITHRDLSSNNVLLIAGCRAKVTDFGMSTLTDAATPQLASMTQCPGTPAYMPPEALKKPPKYSEKLDCFSFGVLIVQVITREFPNPADQLQAKEIVDSRKKKIQAYVTIPELERRQSQINLIPATHPLLQTALDSLNDSDVKRPSSQQLCERLEQIKTTPLYASSIQQIRDKDLLIQTQRETIQNKDKQLQDQQQKLQRIEQENEQLRRQIKQKPKQQHQVRLDTENSQLRQQVQASEELVAELMDKDRQIKHLQRQLQQLEVESHRLQHAGIKNQTTPTQSKLSWRKCQAAPNAMRRGSCVVIHNTVYVNPYKRQDIFTFNYNNMLWSTAPMCTCPYLDSTLTAINNELTTIGGQDAKDLITTNKVLTFHDQKWVELYPPMPTGRYWATVLTTNTHVVVIGGQCGWLDNAQILNIETKQWNTASRLPYRIIQATAALCEGTLYLMGGYSDSDFFVVSCQLKELIEESTPSTERQPQKYSTHSSEVWCKVPDVPVMYSTCVAVQGHVLAIGGKDKQGKRSSVVYRYNQQKNEWTAVSNNMAVARSSSLATVLPDNSLLVIGGVNASGISTDDAEIAIVL